MPSRFTIVLVLSILGALHAWIGWRILPALDVDTGWQIVGGVLLVLSYFLIPAALLSRAMRNQRWADRLSWIGMLTMGLFSSLLLLTIVREVALLALPLFHAAMPEIVESTAWAVIGCALLLTAIGYVNARRLAAVVDVDVPIANLPDALHGFTIIQISDIHIGPTIKRSYLRAVVDKVNGLEADMVAITGDLVDGSVQQLSEHTAPLAQLRSRHGAYFVTGNHEYYSNAHAWIAEVRRLGLTVLMNEHVVLDHGGAALVLAGVTDFTAHHFDESHRSDPHAAIRNAPVSGARILLAHQPRSAAAAADAGFDLQLSGHTHGGQFFPWNFFVPLQQPYVAGLNKLRNLWVYTSRGTGYWGPPKRLLAPSEITRVRLVRA
ncbi:metallophosphoesterase [Herbaspirillum sp. RV1423]|uniref:metallophosphoesterase n=1 Tax=Herbaspirillum sp. RV1423 TaxID=1443993 RepID=UPI0004B0D7CD|nr:metallophosphoesterase [Herbaspirillum sp. RV1423]